MEISNLYNHNRKIFLNILKYASIDVTTDVNFLSEDRFLRYSPSGESVENLVLLTQK